MVSSLVPDAYEWAGSLFEQLRIPYVLDYEELPQKQNCAMFSVVGTGQVIKRYVDGSYIARLNFRIVLRSEADSRSQKLNALRALNDFASACEAGSKPDDTGEYTVFSVNPLTNPAPFSSDDSGTWRDYMSNFELEYRANS